MSARQELAQRIADFIVSKRLTVPYGGDVIKAGNHYSVLFAAAAVLDGVVNVYGPKFIQVTYQTQYRDLPHRANTVFGSESAALDFLNKAFVVRDFAGALAIPTKVK
jgi:hypothetical protein